MFKIIEKKNTQMVTLLIELRSLSKSLEPKVMAIQEAKDNNIIAWSFVWFSNDSWDDDR